MIGIIKEHTMRKNITRTLLLVFGLTGVAWFTTACMRPSERAKTRQETRIEERTEDRMERRRGHHDD